MANTIKTLEEKLVQIQGELKAPKSQDNNFGHYKYRSCEDIFEALKPLLVKYNVLLTVEDKLILKGDRYYVKAIAKLTDGIKFIQVNAYARESLDKKGMDSSQVTGATSSYARKYALNGMFLIDDTKDADTMNNSEEVDSKAVKPTPTKIDPSQITKEMYEKFTSVQQEKVRNFFAKKNGLEVMGKDEFYNLKNW